MFILVTKKNGDHFFLPNGLSSLKTVVEDFDDIVGLKYVAQYPHSEQAVQMWVVPNEKEGLGTNLKRLRKDRSLSQYAVAEGVDFLGVTQATLSKWERSGIEGNNKNLPSLEQLRAILNFYGVLPETYALMEDLWKKEKSYAFEQ